MSEVLEKQLALLQLVGRSLNNFKKIGKNNYTGAKIRSRISTLKEAWAQCLHTHAVLFAAVPEAKREEYDYFKKRMFNEYYECYKATFEYMTECLEDLKPVGSSQAIHTENKQCVVAVIVSFTADKHSSVFEKV